MTPAFPWRIRKNAASSRDLEMEKELALEILGTAGTLLGRDAPAVDEGRWARFALSWPDVVIGGGTPNIQKNIIAERILGLPKD